MSVTWSNVQVTLGELQPWADNPRLSSKRQAQRLLDSWRQFGQVQTVAIGPSNEVYDGHQRLSVLKAAYGPAHEVLALQSDPPAPDVSCGAPADTIDHKIPLSRGGTNDLENLQPMCGECNRRKRDTVKQ